MVKKQNNYKSMYVITKEGCNSHFTITEYDHDVISFELWTPEKVISLAEESLNWENGWNGFMQTDEFISMVDKHFDDFYLMQKEIEDMRIGLDEFDQICIDPKPKLRELIALFEA